MRTRPERSGAKPQATWLAGALACSLVAPAWAQDKLTVEQLQQRLEALERRVGGNVPVDAGEATAEAGLDGLDQRLRILERKLELQQEEQEARTKAAAVIAVNEKGASFKSADGDYEVKIRGLIQGDGRFFLDDDAVPQNDTFLLRTARPIIEGSLGKLVGFRFTPEFAGDSASIVDAYVDLRFDPAYTLRVGKFTSPVGLERLQSSSALSDIERSLASELAPNRDIGIQLQGDAADGRLGYAIGVFNGTVDGRDAATTNPDNNFEYAGRIFFEPFKNSANALSGLGFGIGASVGDKEGSGNNFLARYRTPGQVQFFNYRSAVLADGQQSRWSPQGYYYRNAFGLLAEYIVSKQELNIDGVREDISNKAWQATASYVLTGEDASYRGVVKPAQPFSPGTGGWGAFEVVGRYGALEIDDAAFPLFADPSVAASEATSWTLGLNWYLNSNLKLVVNYLQTSLDGGAAAGADREDEKAVFTRLQVAF
ncbi:porin [Pseudoxanthomonas yeongjuensis]|uniref:OprO/OprP family phosphate-selective porin n=1 Tax=Pseudoxanthomonas yeongjuensis TaxID=377616 RepID=UPI0013910DCE|nr:porin [Pseudoxanthomonas yeongjuensis]KAF1714927.1 porin [Pseudoxanthomonas yeongjuensis]